MRIKYFFLSTLFFSWSFWVIAILLGQNYMAFPTVLFYAIGGFGPSVMGLIFIFRTYNKEELEEFRSRSFNPKRIGLVWYVIIILLPLLQIIISMIIGSFVWNDLTFRGAISTFSFGVFIPSYFVLLVVAVFAEEFGWRAYALDAYLQHDISPIKASLYVGMCWSIWHFPLYLINGTFQNSFGFGSIEFFLYSIDIIPGTFIYTWIYKNNNRSVLSVLLFHFFGNFISEMFEISMRVQIIRLISSFLIAALIILYFRKENS